MEVKVYRHCCQKDIFLARNWHYCGGGATTEFYYATRDYIKAIANAEKEGFCSWMNSFLDEKGKTKLQAKMVEYKEVDIDGFTGTLEKELSFPVREFELVVLREE